MFLKCQMRWQADKAERQRKVVPNGSSYKASNTCNGQCKWENVSRVDC